MVGQHFSVNGITGIGLIVVACFLLLLVVVLTYRLIARGFGCGPEDT